MRYIQCIFVAVVISCASASLLQDIRGELPLILGNIQNKLSVITNANDLSTVQINANAGALANIQTQLNQVIAINTATKNANDAANLRLNSLILSISSFSSAIGALYTANAVPGVGTAYQTLATIIQTV